MVNQERLLQLFKEMVAISSPSGKEGAFCAYLTDYFKARGATCSEDQAGAMLEGDTGNLLVRIAGMADVKPLLFLTHMDTVFAGGDIQAELGEDGIIRSVGKTILAADDKAGIAAILEAYEVIRENQLEHPPLELLFTVSEEQGLLGAKQFDYSCLQAEIAYALDSGGSPGTIVVKSPAKMNQLFGAGQGGPCRNQSGRWYQCHSNHGESAGSHALWTIKPDHHL
jgi:tripeptide aminopeptidase